MLRWLVGLLLLLALACGHVYFAGRGAPPQVTITKPDRIIGQTGSLDVTVEAANARLTELTIALEQNGRTVPLYTMNGPEPRGRSVVRAFPASSPARPASSSTRRGRRF